MPLEIVLLVGELVLEFCGDVISPHASLDFYLKFLNGDTDLGNKLLGLGKIIDALWRLLDPLNNLIELSTQLIVLIQGFLSNEFDFLVNDLLIFSAVVISDIFAVNRED